MAKKSEYRDEFKDIIDKIELEVNDAICELESVDEYSSKSEIQKRMDNALSILNELAEKVY